MRKRGLMKLVVLGAALLTFFATTVSASACVWGLYQPEEPKILQEK